MTDTHAGFLAAIIAEPDDDAVRLIYADWLQDHDQLERAEFIRIQMNQKTWIPHGWHEKGTKCAECERRSVLRRRERKLLDAHGADWFRADRSFACPVERNALMFRPMAGLSPDRFWLGYQRGFLERFDGSSADWLAHADALTAATPLRDVTLTDWPGGWNGGVATLVYKKDVCSVQMSLRAVAVHHCLRHFFGDHIRFTLPPD